MLESEDSQKNLEISLERYYQYKYSFICVHCKKATNNRIAHNALCSKTKKT